jgi:hypothetical protein
MTGRDSVGVPGLHSVDEFKTEVLALYRSGGPVRKFEDQLPALPVLELAVLPMVESGDGSELLLSLLRDDGSGLSVRLGPAEAIAIAGDLIQAARVRMGRADWPGTAIGVSSSDD